MKQAKILWLFLVLLTTSQISFGQNIEDEQPMENWLKQYTGFNEPFLYHRFDLYSKSDVVKFREKLDLILNSKNTDEWNGTYSTGFDDSVGYSQLRLKSDVGFASFYVYTCMPELRRLNYGKIIQNDEIIKLTPEFVKDSPRKFQPITYVKVKWGENRYLVEESSIAAFAEKVVGIYVESNDDLENRMKWSNYWVSFASENDPTGLPEFPVSYKKFQRNPIEAKIVSVGTRKIEERTLGDAFYSESAFYEVKIDAGKNKNVKEGMTFEIPDVGSKVVITKVNSKTSVGLIHRDIDENDKTDICRDDNFDQISCPEIKPSLNIKTLTGRLWIEFF